MKEELIKQEELELKKKAQKGFTLIELLVVVAIIAILAAIAIPQFSKYKQSAYKDAVRSDIKNAATAVEAFAADYGHYPFNSDSDSEITCGPGPTQCDLEDDKGNNIPKALNVSRDVTITITGKSCGTGEVGYTIEGKHAQINEWTASYDSCTGEYSNF